MIFLFKGAQRLNRFCSDIVKGLGSFDLDVMLVDPLERAEYCFRQLFTCFRLRVLFHADKESIHTEEYLSFLDAIRHVGIQQTKLLITDAIDFISGRESLGSRTHLQRIFRLSFLCLDEHRLSFSPVKFGSHHTDVPQSPMSDVNAPIQCYYMFFVDWTFPLQILPFLVKVLLEQSFGNAGLSDVYSPWDSIDHFGRAQIREIFALIEPRGETTSRTSRTEKSIAQKTFPVPKPKKQRSHLLPEEELTDSAPRLVASCSKN